MAKYSYETYEDLRKSAQTNSTSRQRSRVGYFKLSDGEEAIVRFDYSSPKDFDIITIHNIKVGDKYRKVSCLRTDGREPLDNCPLCARGDKVMSRFFAKLIHYTKDASGKVIATPEVANFPKKMADKLVKFIQEYGDLKDILVKVSRTGSSLETEYDIVFANPAIYKEELGYVKDFKDLLLNLHHNYVEKSKEDIEEYLKTGEFPYHKQSTTQETTTTKYVSEPKELDLMDDGEMDRVFGMQPQVEEKPTTTTTTTDITSRPRRTYDFSK